MRSITDPGDFPKLPGAYGLLLKLDSPKAVPVPRGTSSSLSPGTYLYCGSAKGPGGLRARLLRHLKGDKRPHWHIDLLADQNSVLAVVGYFELSECEIVTTASQAMRGDFPLKGFGSSDCRTCPSHLLRIEEELGRDSIEDKMRPDFIWTR